MSTTSCSFRSLFATIGSSLRNGTIDDIAHARRPSFLLTFMKQSTADLYMRSSAGLSESSIIRRRIVSKG